MYRTSLGISTWRAMRSSPRGAAASPLDGKNWLMDPAHGSGAARRLRRAAPVNRVSCLPATRSRAPAARTALLAACVRSEALERPLARIRDLEQRVQLRQLEQRLQVVVEVGEPELPTLFANLLRQRHQHTEPRAVDVAGLAEVDEELLLTLLQLVENLLLQLLPVTDDELTFHVNHDDVSLLLDREAHGPVLSGGVVPAWSSGLAVCPALTPGLSMSTTVPVGPPVAP